MRPNWSDSAAAKARASSVLAVPGTPSSSTWPLGEQRDEHAGRSTWSCPTTTRRTVCRRRSPGRRRDARSDPASISCLQRWMRRATASTVGGRAALPPRSRSTAASSAARSSVTPRAAPDAGARPLAQPRRARAPAARAARARRPARSAVEVAAERVARRARPARSSAAVFSKQDALARRDRAAAAAAARRSGRVARPDEERDRQRRPATHDEHQREREQLAPERGHALVPVQRLVEHDRLAGLARVARARPGDGALSPSPRPWFASRSGSDEDQQHAAVLRVLALREQPAVAAGDERRSESSPRSAEQLRPLEGAEAPAPSHALDAAARREGARPRAVRRPGARSAISAGGTGAARSSQPLWSPVLAPCHFGSTTSERCAARSICCELARSAWGERRLEPRLGHDQQRLLARAVRPSRSG